MWKHCGPGRKFTPPPSSLLVWVVLSASHKKKPRVRRLKKSRKKILHQNIWFSSCRTSTTILDESNLFCGVSPLCWCFFQGKRGEWGRRWRDLCSMRITRNLERRIRKAIDLCLDVFVYCPSRGIKYVFLVSLCVCVCVCTQCVQDGIPFFGWCWKRRSGASSVIQWLPRSVGFVAHFGHCTEFRIPQSRENGLASLISPLPPFFFHQRLGQRSRIKRKRPPSSAHPPLFRVCGFIGHLAGWPHL